MSLSIYWMRRDLRLEDNAALYHALKSGHKVLPVFIFDQNILDDLEDKKDARVTFIYQEIKRLKDELHGRGSDIRVYYGKPEEIWNEIVEEHSPKAVFINRDYEPYAIHRDDKVRSLLKARDISLYDYKDHVIFDYDEVLKDNGDPYVVFTPYKRKWFDKLNSRGKGKKSYYLKSYPNEKYLDELYQMSAEDLIRLEDMGFEKSDIDYPPRQVTQGLIKSYGDKRNYPAIDGTSRLGIHYRFGTISIREKARKAMELSTTYVNELIWRDFYSMILQHYPKVEKNAFREKYDNIEWRNNEKEFQLWCEGKTGYPMVDAGMRQLNKTGYMHNRVRMVVASFLTKHLLIDWRWGEAYFAKKLLDYDLASNNGGWQWAAGSGTDAAPYFRIFNPESQFKKFDPDAKYVKRYVPEYGTDNYPNRIVDHKEARERCLAAYKAALN